MYRMGERGCSGLSSFNLRGPPARSDRLFFAEEISFPWLWGNYASKLHLCEVCGLTWVFLPPWVSLL